MALKNPVSDSEVVSDSDDERYETAGPPCLAARLIVWQKIKHEQPISPGGISLRGPQCD